MTLDELQANVRAASLALKVAEVALENFQRLAENNVFDSVEEAYRHIEGMLRNRAFEDCEGAGNCGDEKYVQEFMVGNKKYRGIASVEYNRHDKTYYFIDDFVFDITEVTE